MVDAETQKTIARAYIYQVSDSAGEAGLQHETTGEARSADDGAFHLPLAATEGEVRLGALAEGYAPAELGPWAAEEARAGADPVRVELMPARGVLRGRVVDESARGIPGAVVWCAPIHSRVVWARRLSRTVRAPDLAPWATVTDTSGSFELRGLPVDAEYRVYPRVAFHAPAGLQQLRARPDGHELLIRMQRVALVAWRSMREGQPVPPDGILTVAVQGRVMGQLWDGALPADVKQSELESSGYVVQMACADPSNTAGTDEVVLVRKSLRSAWGSGDGSIRVRLGEFRREDLILEPIATVDLALEVAFVGGTRFDGQLSLMTPDGEWTSARVRGGRAQAKVPRDSGDIRVLVGGLAASWWQPDIAPLRAADAVQSPLTVRLRGGRVELQVRARDGDHVDSFDLEVTLAGGAMRGWERDYARRLREADEAKVAGPPFVWLPPGTHTLRVNHARLGLADTQVTVPEDGSSQLRELVLDPSRAIDLTRPLR